MKLRVIVQSSKNEEEEYVTFIPDWEDLYNADIRVFIMPNCHVDTDITIKKVSEMPISFPYNHRLKRMS